MLTGIAIAVALFFAMNIGASGAAASMGVAYGSGAIEKKRIALLLVACGVILGAIIGGDEVVRTLGSGIIPTDVLTVKIVIIILGSATLTLFGANMLGIPLSTSEVTVGAIVGVGVAVQSLYTANVIKIVLFWVAVPFISFLIAFVLGKIIIHFERRYPVLTGPSRWRKYLVALVIFTGFMEAFSAGMNNVANAVGPLVGAEMMAEVPAIWLGAVFVGIGALLLGGRVLETNGKKITRLTLLQGSSVSGTGAFLVITASLYGVPIPLTQITTTAIMGVGAADRGFKIWQRGIVMRILKVWIVSPVISLVVSYGVYHSWIDYDPYALVIVVSVLIATAGMISLYRSIRADKGTSYESGDGI